MFRPLTARRAALVAALVATAASGLGSCRKSGTTLGIRTRILVPQGEDALGGLATVDVFVKQFPGATATSAQTVGVATFAPAEPWEIPDSGASSSKPLFVEVQGKDASGAIVRIGRTRVIDPKTAQQHVFGIYFARPGIFSPLPAAPSTLRAHAGVAVLDDGRVVLAGGYDENGNAVSSAELYDADTGTWTPLAALSLPRIDPGMAALPDGRVLVAGGRDASGADLSSTEYILPPLADPSATPYPAATPGSLPAAGSGMRSVRFASGHVLFAGGFSTDTANRLGPAAFDPETREFTVPAGGVYAAGAGLALVAPDRAVIVGGTAGTAVLASVQVAQDSASSGVTFGTPADVLHVARSGAATAAVRLADGSTKVLVCGGATAAGATRPTAAVELVDASGVLPTSAFSQEREREHRAYRSASVLGDGRVIYSGGLDLDGVPDDAAEIWDPATQTADDAAPLPSPRVARSIELGDGTVLFAGGGVADAFVYVPPVTPLPARSPRVPFTITPVLGLRAAGSVLDGVAGVRVRAYDFVSLVDERAYPASASTLSWPSFLVDNEDLHFTIEALSSTGGALAWGATTLALDSAGQTAGTLSLLLGRTNEFVESPADLPNVHADGAAAVLDDGRVVVAAGTGSPALTDYFDPTDGSTGVVNSAIPTARHETRFAVANGKLVVSGGLNGAGNPSAATSLFDLATGTWSTGPVTPGGPRYHHALVTLPGGDILSYGNESATNVPLAASERYDGVSWTASGAATAVARSRHQLTLLGGGLVLATGGLTSNGIIAVSGTAELYDPGTQTWTPTTGTLVTARRDHIAFATGASGAVLCGGRVTVATGTPIASCERFNEGSGTFTSFGALSAARDDLAVARLLDGRVLMMGGQLAGGVRTTAVDVWDPGSGVIAAGPSLVAPRSAAPAVVLPDGRIVIAGGFDSGAAPLATVEVFTPPTWTNPF